jgi:hypothetical protein
MELGYLHNGPSYSIATSLNIAPLVPELLTLTQDEARRRLAGLLPPVAQQDVTQVNAPDIQLPTPTLVGIPRYQANFDHLFYFSLITSCQDPTPFNIGLLFSPTPAF